MLRLIALFLASLLFTGTAVAKPAPISEAVYEEIRSVYGEQAEQRYRRLFAWMSDHWDLDEVEKARQVNYLANNLPWIADQQKYSKKDYWATPLETITTFGGDCEDIAITKWAILRAMGVAPDRLRLAHVKLVSTGEAHMVLAYSPEPDAPPESRPVFVLDNIAPEMLDYRKRKDFRVIYTVGAERDVRVYRDNGKTIELVKSVEDAKVKKILEIQDKIAVSREHYRELNGGRPLF